MCYDEHSTLFRPADNNKTAFFAGMVWVIKSIREGITENSRGFLKRDTMLRHVARRFVFVPLKQHVSNLVSLIHHHASSQEAKNIRLIGQDLNFSGRMDFSGKVH